MRLKNTLLASFTLGMALTLSAKDILVKMNNLQKNHLKAYGLVYNVLDKNMKVEWLLNYEGGSFIIYDKTNTAEILCQRSEITFEELSDRNLKSIKNQIEKSTNYKIVLLAEAPRLAVYAPEGGEVWDDPVVMALEFSNIPYTRIYDEEVLNGDLSKYQWLHLHHEDFTGQFNRFYASSYTKPWYKEYVLTNTNRSKAFGFAKVSDMKLQVAKNIKSFVNTGGYLFAMCTGAESIDVALAAEGLDIAQKYVDGTDMTPDVNSKLNFKNTFAFQNFQVNTEMYTVNISNIGLSNNDRKIEEDKDKFYLKSIPSYDMIATALTQNHSGEINGFLGQITAFQNNFVKPNITILADNKRLNESKYIYGKMGQGSFTFYGGHDPEDFRHTTYEKATDLSLFPQSAGYRLILNNILLPSSELNQNVNAFSIYPNPAKDILNITFEKELDKAEINIFDLDGKLLITKSIKNTNKTTINVGDFAPAIYTVYIKSDAFEGSQKLVKE